MNNKPSITYIKNKEQKEETFNKLKEKIFLKKPNRKILTSKYQIISNNITYLHIKDYKFTNDFILHNYYHHGMRCKEIILENCIFEGNRILLRNFPNIKLINPKFKNDIYINISRCDNVEIILKEETKDISLSILMFENLKLIANKKITSLELEILESLINNIFIKNFFKNLSIFDNSEKSNIENLILEDSIIKLNEDSNLKLNLIKNINLINSSIESYKNLDFKHLSNLELTNSHITANKIDFNNLENLIFKDEKDAILDTSSYIEVKEDININKKLIKNYNQEENLIITESSFQNDLHIKKQELLFILKQLSNTLNKKVEEEKNKEKQRLLNEIEKKLDKRLAKNLSLQKVDKYF